MTWPARDRRLRRARTDAMNDQQFDRAMRYALQAYPARGRLLGSVSSELEGKLAGRELSARLHRRLKGHSDQSEARSSAAMANGW